MAIGMYLAFDQPNAAPTLGLELRGVRGWRAQELEKAGEQVLK